MTKQFFSRREFAHGADISVRTLDALISNQQVRAIRIGRRVLIPVTELERLGRRQFHPTSTPVNDAVVHAGGAA